MDANCPVRCTPPATCQLNWFAPPCPCPVTVNVTPGG